jgi:hypothetical protein
VEKEQKPKWKKGFFEALGSTNWLLLSFAKCVFLPTPRPAPGVVVFPRMKITTDEFEHDGHVRPESSLGNRLKPPAALMGT